MHVSLRVPSHLVSAGADARQNAIQETLNAQVAAPNTNARHRTPKASHDVPSFANPDRAILSLTNVSQRGFQSMRTIHATVTEKARSNVLELRRSNRDAELVGIMRQMFPNCNEHAPSASVTQLVDRMVEERRAQTSIAALRKARNEPTPAGSLSFEEHMAGQVNWLLQELRIQREANETADEQYRLLMLKTAEKEDAAYKAELDRRAAETAKDDAFKLLAEEREQHEATRGSLSWEVQSLRQRLMATLEAQAKGMPSILTSSAAPQGGAKGATKVGSPSNKALAKGASSANAQALPDASAGGPGDAEPHGDHFAEKEQFLRQIVSLRVDLTEAGKQISVLEDRVSMATANADMHRASVATIRRNADCEVRNMQDMIVEVRNQHERHTSELDKQYKSSLRQVEVYEAAVHELQKQLEDVTGRMLSMQRTLMSGPSIQMLLYKTFVKSEDAAMAQDEINRMTELIADFVKQFEESNDEARQNPEALMKQAKRRQLREEQKQHKAAAEFLKSQRLGASQEEEQRPQPQVQLPQTQQEQQPERRLSAGESQSRETVTQSQQPQTRRLPLPECAVAPCVEVRATPSVVIHNAPHCDVVTTAVASPQQRNPATSDVCCGPDGAWAEPAALRGTIEQRSVECQTVPQPYSEFATVVSFVQEGDRSDASSEVEVVHRVDSIEAPSRSESMTGSRSIDKKPTAESADKLISRAASVVKPAAAKRSSTKTASVKPVAAPTSAGISAAALQREASPTTLAPSQRPQVSKIRSSETPATPDAKAELRTVESRTGEALVKRSSEAGATSTPAATSAVSFVSEDASSFANRKPTGVSPEQLAALAKMSQDDGFAMAEIERLRDTKDKAQLAWQETHEKWLSEQKHRKALEGDLKKSDADLKSTQALLSALQAELEQERHTFKLSKDRVASLTASFRQLEQEFAFKDEQHASEVKMLHHDVIHLRQENKRLSLADARAKLRRKERLFCEGVERMLRCMRSMHSTSACSVCLEPLRDPIVLVPCGHVACSACFRRLNEEHGLRIVGDSDELVFSSITCVSMQAPPSAQTFVPLSPSGSAVLPPIGALGGGSNHRSSVSGSVLASPNMSEASRHLHKRLQTATSLGALSSPEKVEAVAYQATQALGRPAKVCGWFCDECAGFTVERIVPCQRFREVIDNVDYVMTNIEEIRQGVLLKASAVEENAEIAMQQYVLKDSSEKTLNESKHGADLEADAQNFLLDDD
jgi:hypothetical protein